MKILIANAFYLANDKKQIQEKFKPYPPLATLYAISVLRANGFSDVCLFDATLSVGVSEFRDTLEELSPDILVIYEDDFNFLSKMCLNHVRESTFEMSRLAANRNISVITHSADASDNPEAYLEQNIDFVIYGEGEQTLADLLKWIGTGNENSSPPPGTIHLSGSQVVKEPGRKNHRTLDQLGQPAWDLIDFSSYRTAWEVRHHYFSINMVTTRGCPYNCNWCSKPIWGQQYAAHSPEYIVDQVSELIRLANPDHIWFSDDIFGLKKDWVLRFSHTMRSKGIRIPFMIQSRADLIDEELAAALFNAGCDEVWLGVESGSQRILDLMNKDLSLEQVERACELLKAQGIKVGFFIQLGYPSEDIEEINKTRELIIQFKPDNIGVSVSYPLPGTPFYERVKYKLNAKTHWEESDDLDAVFNSTFQAEFYRLVRTHLHEELDASRTTESKLVYNWQNAWVALMKRANKYRNSDTCTLSVQ
jgi:anaerobic magnesium-protoporphyrin IX monomethyl ester cyclase